MLLTGSAVAQMPVQAVYLRGSTNSGGNFTINHQYQAEPNNCEGTRIVGATVAIHNTNGVWYVLNEIPNTRQAISFKNGQISGYYRDPGFENQPVRVVLFLSHDLC